jgi:hypothetical protein
MLAIGKAGAINATLLAAAILALQRSDLHQKLYAFRKEQAEKILKETLEQVGGLGFRAACELPIRLRPRLLTSTMFRGDFPSHGSSEPRRAPSSTWSI